MNDQITAFVAAMNEDDEFKTQAHAAASAQEVIALAATRGITLTEADLTAAAADGADLSDADLENASGGTYMGFTRYACFGTMGCPRF